MDLEAEVEPANGTLVEDVMAGVRDETHPLVTLLETTPHAMSLLIKPWNYHPDTMVRSPEFCCMEKSFSWWDAVIFSQLCAKN